MVFLFGSLSPTFSKSLQRYLSTKSVVLVSLLICKVSSAAEKDRLFESAFEENTRYWYL